MRFFSNRQYNSLCLLLVLTILGTAVYLQIGLGLEPCPLCLLQRFCFILLGLLFLFGIFYSPRKLGHIIHGSLIFLVAVLGGIIAGRQIWLQHLPAGQAPACMPGFYYLLQHFPLGEALPIIFKGSEDCADTQWLFLHLSMAEWSLAFFTLFAVWGVVQMVKRD
jgi:disulfide bond formation protein DsbB